MITQDIRRKFLDYFRNQGHTVVPSSSVVPHDDPTLLFINAGMNQFKDVFLGKTVRDYKRATTSQKCIRVGGKHNDLENVGHTARHLTFFEMIGNFSFGDYFKKEAIKFAWDVATKVFEFEPDRIWPTVYKDDDEAFELWKEYVPEERITRFGEKENFWAMGDTGPCGPCSELLYDRGPKYGKANNPLEDVEETRFLEFWNLVFMQYNRDENGVLNPLPKPSIDTGAGLERIIALKMDVDNVYDTDILRSLIEEVEKVSGVKYENNDKAPAFKVIADHLRCLAFAISDGVQPSNVDRGYVLRKVLRRAVRYGRTLGMEEPFLGKVLPKLVELMGDDYPELVKNEERIIEILTVEEEAFNRTLKRGGNILNQIIDEAQKEKRKISGEEAFKLKDTYGFPLEEILLLAVDADLEVDQKRFTELEMEAKERSRKVHKKTKQVAGENLFEALEPSEFLGYTETQSEGKILAIVKDDAFAKSLNPGEEGIIVLDRTPFYAEKGGQVGDTGTLYNDHANFAVSDCQEPFKDVIAHIGKVNKGTLKVGDFVTAHIDEERRQKIANNHTATHLLHWALAKVLGEHVKQAGSVVDADRLRFDFSHHKGLTKQEIQEIEDLVNHRIRENLGVKWYELPYEEVMKKDEIKQFFGEKYDKIVRVIDIDYSKELCGGTHTSKLGNIGLFRIAKEGSIAAGVRRIEAVSGEAAEAIYRSEEALIEEASDKLKTAPDKLLIRIEKLLEENKELGAQLKELKKGQLKGVVEELKRKAHTLDDVSLISEQVSLSSEELRDVAAELQSNLSSSVIVLATQIEDRCQIIAGVTDDLVAKGIKANEIIKTLAPIVGGGGGGKANLAQAGGKNPEKIAEALSKAKTLLTHAP